MISLGLFCATLLLVGILPLLGGPRYEAALACGVLGPSWVAVTCAARTARRLRRMGSRKSAARLLLLALGDGARFFVALLVTQNLLGLFVGFCEPQEGNTLLVLGPGLGLLLSSQWGALLGAALFAARGSTRVPRGLFALGIVGPLISAAWAVVRFYRTPTVFAYDQFAGYFSGPLYDTVVYDLPRLASFRAGTAALILSGLTLGRLFCLQRVDRGAGRPGPLRFSLRALPWKSQVQVWAFSTIGLAAFVYVQLRGEELGHRGTASSIQQALGGELKDGPCRVYFAATLPLRRAQRIARQCRGHLRQHAEFFGLDEVAPVSVYLFSDTEQKRRLMGAGNTNIAKPWRREVYITASSFPHPILGHELAHAVSGAFGRGPFRVAGSLGGWIMDPGRVEGFAEAAALRESSFGTLEQWAAAMKQVKRLPPLRQLFQLGFFGESAARSYTAAGAFVGYLRERFGPDLLRKWYAGGALARLTDKSLAELESEWFAHLDGIEVPEAVLVAARPKFSRPGLFARRCPHASDRLMGEFTNSCGRDRAKSDELVKQLLSWDPNREGLRLELPRCAARRGNVEQAGRAMELLLQEEDTFEPHEVRRAEEFLGDVAWHKGEVDQARLHYQKAHELATDPDQQRQLEVRTWATSQDIEVEQPLLRLFTSWSEQGWSTQGALLRLHEEPETRDFSGYLLARVALSEQRFEEARSWMEEVDPAALELDSLRREFVRMRLRAACEQAMMTGNQVPLDGAARDYGEEVQPDPDNPHWARFIERCRWASQAEPLVD